MESLVAKSLIQNAQDGAYIAIKRLLNDGANPNIRDKDGWTAINAAAYRGHLKVCQLLVANGAKVNSIDGEGWTALHWAARYGKIDVCEYLVLEGWKFDLTQVPIWSPKHKQKKHPWIWRRKAGTAKFRNISKVRL